MRRGHDLGEIWVEGKVGPSLAWGHNKAPCRAVEWFSGSISVHNTGYNADTHYTKFMSPPGHYQRRYLNRGA